MGPLWAWVVLWVVSAYGLVILLRRAMMRPAGEPVPVLVATPQPVEPSPAIPDPDPSPVVLDPDPSPVVLDPDPSPVVLDPDPSPVVLDPDPSPVVLDPDPSPVVLDPDPSPLVQDPELRDLEASSEAMAIEPAELSPLDVPPDPMPMPDSPELGANPEPFALDDLPADHDSGGHEEDSQPEDARIPEPEAGEPGFSEPDLEEPEESEPIVYRAIELESLTLGLQSSEIQGLYGPPGHMSKVGEDGEQWRYPLSATDDRGQGLEGVLVLEFQRGRLVRKALEQAEAER